ncbi:MAG: CBS domain-containing protein [Gammaproteobacteria bacterium]
MRVGDICTRNVISIAADESIYDAAQKMREQHVGDVIVVMDDRERCIGILTDRDITIEVVANRVDPDTLTVRDVMSDEVLMVDEDEDILEAMEMMSRAGVRRLPVMNEGRKLCGVISIDDIIGSLAESLLEVSTLAHRQRHREEHRRAV